MKGIILAGGAGSRLYPITSIITKQLQPIYDKPMIYYPLSLLMLGGIKDILIVTTPTDLPHFQKLLGNGSQLGISIEYKIQNAPRGIPEAFTIGRDFIGDDDVNLILGDNLFYGDIQFYRDALSAQKNKLNGQNARVFAYPVTDPERYGVVTFDKNSGRVEDIEEKPEKPKSNFAIPGLYLFDNSVVKRTEGLTPGKRGETEIVDLIKSYLDEKSLGVSLINRGVAWLDTGTPKALLEASSFISAIEERQGLKVACIEEVALRMEFIDKTQYATLIERFPKSSYREYLEMICSEI